MTPSSAASLWHAAFHGDPSDGQPTDPPQDELERWLHGVCLGAIGRYGAAADVLCPDGTPAGSLAASARASHLRQLGRHAEAARLDELALHLAAAAPEPDEARPDALVGLVADAIGQAESDVVVARLAQADQFVAGLTGPRHWRARVRLSWVRAEAALLHDDSAGAVTHARSALRHSRAASAPRHETKSLLVLGVAATSADTLERAAVQAESLGLLPLVWPARLVRSRLVSTPERQRELDAATAVLRQIAQLSS